MPSRLSSLLVRDGLVGVKRMEKAFQRQVIYGGTLDTILLEMTLVPEDRLTQYLALASGLPPAARDEGTTIEARATALLGADLASQFRAVPLSLDGEAVRMLVCAPLELEELEDLADLLDRPLQPLIAPEYRWHLVYARAYGVDVPARFVTLSRQLDADSTPAPVGRARSVVVDGPSEVLDAPPEPLPTPTRRGRNEPPVLPAAGRPAVAAAAPAAPVAPIAPVPVVAPVAQLARAVSSPPEPSAPAAPKLVPAPPILPGEPQKGAREHAAEASVTPVVIAPSAPPDVDHEVRDTVRMDAVIPPADLSELVEQAQATPERPKRATLPGVKTTAPEGVLRPPAVTDPPPFADATKPSSEAITPSTGIPRAIGDAVRARRASASPTIQVRPRRGVSAPIDTAGRDTPLAIVPARELLATAEDRDTVFLTLLRATRSRTRYAALLTVQGGAAIGRVALAEPGLDVAQVQTVLIPLDVASPFAQVVTKRQPHIGPLASGDPSVDAMVMRMGGALPPSAMVLPIVLRDRVVAIVIAHRGHSDLRVADVTEVLPLARAAADALGRLIVGRKAAGFRTPSVTPSVPIEVEQIITKKLVRPDAQGWRAPAPRDSMPVIQRDPEIAFVPPPQRPMDAVLDDIERAREFDAEDAMSDAVERSTEALVCLMNRFPGKLRTERFAVAGRPLRAAQYGGLLELTVRLGGSAAELLIDKMRDPSRDVRFYATVCTAELRPRSAMFALVERLFDQDFGVRATAIEALAGYPLPELQPALAKARHSVHSSDPETVAAATSALVALGDIDAVGELISAVERGDRGGEHARRALVSLTAQDFGTSERKWRKWYEGARKRHRIEWLIEGLGHKEDAVREAAIHDLRRLTGEYFGYHFDLPKRERELAAERWASWWRDTGKRRFVAART